jgi:hypothetical protein
MAFGVPAGAPAQAARALLQSSLRVWASWGWASVLAPSGRRGPSPGEALDDPGDAAASRASGPKFQASAQLAGGVDLRGKPLGQRR